eukprot:COSAG02_NODE_92_length_37588_cov_135.916242_38_plen_358_part_00
MECWHGTGLDEFRSCLDSRRVQFGVIRFELGSGAFMRSKYCFVHFVGGDVAAVKRGKHNARKEEIMAAMQGSHTDISFTSVQEVTVDAILQHMLSTIGADEGGEGGAVDISAFRQQMEEQMAAAPEPEPEPAAGDEAPAGTGAPTAVDLGISFQDALGQVRSERGSLNWLLAEPNASAPALVNAGSGSIPEMRQFLAEDRVLYGLVRAGFGAGAFKRVKFLFWHWTGPNVSMVKRGKWNAEKDGMQELMRPFTMDMTANNVEETEVDYVVDAIKAVIVSDGDDDSESMISVAAFLEAIKEEQEAAKAQHQSAQKAPSHVAPPAGAAAAVQYINFDASVADLRKPATQRNWMLCALIK